MSLTFTNLRVKSPRGQWVKNSPRTIQDTLPTFKISVKILRQSTINPCIFCWWDSIIVSTGVISQELLEKISHSNVFEYDSSRFTDISPGPVIEKYIYLSLFYLSLHTYHTIGHFHNIIFHIRFSPYSSRYIFSVATVMVLRRLVVGLGVWVVEVVVVMWYIVVIRIVAVSVKTFKGVVWFWRVSLVAITHTTEAAGFLWFWLKMEH